jgi:hypothetical protein
VRLFRLKRKGAIDRPESSKYLKYAIGETIIVVLGILIAIQLNNWNQKRLEKNQIENYYARIKEEVKVNLKLLSSNAEYTQDSIVHALQIAKDIVQNSKADSLEVLFENIKWLTETESLAFQFPIIEEFVSKGYLSEIKDPGLNNIFILYNYSKQQCDIADELTRAYQIHLIKPFLLKNTQYAAIDYYNTDRRYNAAIAVQLGALLGNEELENLMSMYIVHFERTIVNFKDLINNLQMVDKRISALKKK